jgi:putative ABC transport system permease protein
MGALIGALRENPDMRRIAIIGNHAFDPARMAEVATWPEIGFVAPQERSLARRMEARPPEARAFERVTLVASGPNEPLLPGAPVLADDEIALSASLAQRWGVGPGATLDARAVRGDPPTARMATVLRVAAVVPRGWLQGDSALVTPALARTLEAFYDGYAVPDYGVSDGRPLAERPLLFESLRVYAADIRLVEALEARLERELRVTVNSRVAEIAPLLALERDVGRALAVLTVCAGLGLAAALATLFWSTVERKRRDLALLALMGVAPRELALFTLAQATLYAVGGWLAATSLFLGGVAVFRGLFASHVTTSGPVVPLDPLMLAAVLAGVVLLAALAATAAAARAARADPAIAIRQGA